MTSKKAIALKIQSLRQYMLIIRKLESISLKKLETDDILRGAVERYLYLACQAAIDIAEQVVALKRLPSPQSAADAFDTLADAGFIKRELAEQLIAMVGFRNILAHGYESVDYRIVKKILVSGKEDLIALVRSVEKLIK